MISPSSSFCFGFLFSGALPSTSTIIKLTLSSARPGLKPCLPFVHDKTYQRNKKKKKKKI